MSETYSKEIITPAIAKRELEEQEKRIANGEYNQRRINEDTVAKYANDMKQGHWLFNNQGIGYDERGNLVDGRHRLWAIVKAGVPVKMLVVKGMEGPQNGGASKMSLMDTIDCGRVRTVQNKLQIDGVKSASAMSAGARAIGLLCCQPEVKKFSIITIREILAIYGPGLEKVFHCFQTALCRGALLGPLAMYHEMKPRKAVEFCTTYATMVGMEQGSPVLAVKKYMEIHKTSGTDHNVKAIYAVCLAICHYENGEKVNILRNTDIGINWMKKEQKANVKHLRALNGMED
jgi:hypothetical protein